MTPAMRFSTRLFLRSWVAVLFCTLLAASLAWTDKAFSADPILLGPSEGVTVTCAAGVEDCPKPLPGNSHAVVHSQLANQDGGASCRECHGVPGEAVTAGQTMLCSQYPFRFPGIVMIDPNTGSALADPVSGHLIVTGGEIGGYNAGADVECRDCHYPHQRGVKEPEDREIHAGCLDCHRRVGSDSLRPGVKEDDD